MPTSPRNSRKFPTNNSIPPFNSSKPTARFISWRGSRVSRAGEKSEMANGRGTLTKTTPFFARHHGMGLRLCRQTPDFILPAHALVLGAACRTAGLFSHALDFSPRARTDLSRRLHFALDANQRTDRPRRYFASQSVHVRREDNNATRKASGLERFHLLPTLCWLDSSDSFLNFQCAAGTVLAVI